MDKTMVIVAPCANGRELSVRPYAARIPLGRFRVGESVMLPVVFGTEAGAASTVLKSEKTMCKIVEIHEKHHWFRVAFSAGRDRIRLTECYKYVIEEV